MTSDIFVSRQPIFNGDRRVTAYELHHRTGRLAAVGGNDDADTAIQMIDHAILGIGLDVLLGKRPGMLAVPGKVMVGGQVTALPTDRIVLHVQAPERHDPALVAACVDARQAGFSLAISEAQGETDPELLRHADYVSVDFRRYPGDARADAVARLKGSGCQLLAKHLGSYADFYEAQAAGFDFFQGPFFCEPELFTTRELNSSSHALTMLIAEVNRPDLDMEALERLISRDVALSVKLLRYLQSAGLGWRHEVGTIGQALRILGQRPTRKWASLVSMTMLPTDKPPELFTTSLLRAQFCEEIGGEALGEAKRAELFLVGLLSTLDALLDRPMSMLVGEMALSQDAAAALLGEASPLTPWLQLSVAYDKGDWDTVDALTARLKLAPTVLPDAYHRTVAWVAEVLAVE
ncbi:MAG TPA: HDOD domain-containing protein [Gemmatimonadales bacterium]|nr:HDOD domain-containing protein [Gemmatimonadales bacterium]